MSKKTKKGKREEKECHSEGKRRIGFSVGGEAFVKQRDDFLGLYLPCPLPYLVIRRLARLAATFLLAQHIGSRENISPTRSCLSYRRMNISVGFSMESEGCGL